MIAITNEEKYLAKIAGEEITTPEPVLRKEQYLSAIANGEGTIPELPYTREEQYLAILAGENFEIPTPETRLERYMAKACGLDIDTPTPITNVEYYWAIIAEGGSWPITTLTGSLPLTYESRTEHILKNYVLYGSASGAGVETENLYNKDSDILGKYLNTSGGIETNQAFRYSSPIPVAAGEYTLCNIGRDSSGLQYTFRVVGYDQNDNYVEKPYSYTFVQPEYISPTFTVAPGIAYIRLSYRYVQGCDASNLMLTTGSTAPTSYIPYGYKIPLTNTGENSQSETYPLYIGSSALGAEEYLDYAEQKVYKRTENLFDKDNTEGIEDNYYIDKTTGNKVRNAKYYISAPIAVTSDESYQWFFGVTWSVTTHSAPTVAFFDANDDQIGVASHGDGIRSFSFTTPANCVYVRASVFKSTSNESMLVKGSTAPAQYIPYLQPTDPPAPFPAITAYKGENTLSSTETVGEVEITGEIKEAVPNG